MSNHRHKIGADTIYAKDPALKLVVGGLPQTYEEFYGALDFEDDDVPNWRAVKTLLTTSAIELLGVTSDTIQAISGGLIVEKIYIIKNSGTLSIKIGLTSGGDEIYPDTNVDPFNNIQVQQYFATNGNLYFDLTGSGNINIYIFYTKLL